MNKEEFNKAIQLVISPLPGSHPEEVYYRLSVKKGFENLPIIDFFMKAVPNSNRTIWEEKIKNKTLKVNDSPVNAEYKVKAGDITSHVSEPKTEPIVGIDIQLIHNDKNLLIVNKPAPLPIHASGRFSRNTLLHILSKAFPNENFKLLHRLDANTTGIVVIAKNRETANFMRLQFESQQIEKRYYALIEGILETKTAVAQAKVGKEVLIGGARKIDALGKEAKTVINVIKLYTELNQSLVQLEPKTGRTNQIRLHLSNIGHPIVGDLGYKDANYFKSNPFTYPEDSLFLHAHQISFECPTHGKRVTFEAPLPSKFNILIA